MAIEKMEMLNMVGYIGCMDEVARTIVLSSSVHMVNALTEIQKNNFSILLAQEYPDAVIDYNYIKQYTSAKNLGKTEEKIKALSEILDVKNKVYSSYLKQDYDFEKDMQSVDELYEEIKDLDIQFKKFYEQLNHLNELEQYLSPMRHLNFDLAEAMSMKYITLKFGKISKYDMDKLKKNYENIPAIVLKLNADSDFVSVLMFIPEAIEEEAERALRSLNFHPFEMNFNFTGTPAEWLKAITDKKAEINEKINTIRKELNGFKKFYAMDVNKYYSRLMLEFKAEEVKSHIVYSNDFFYLSGWIPHSKKQMLLNRLEKYDEKVIMHFKKSEEYDEVVSPPTSLTNNRLLKPFESILKMYGLPSYNEIDPTPFMGLSYMFLFGAMFGDVGQGFVFFLAGLLLKLKMNRPNLGGVLASLGISSMVFGFLYGSIFGFEDIIEGSFIKPIKPMENINFMLLAAIVLGVILLSAGYIYNIVNSYRRKDLENGLFSNNGLAGLLFFWTLLYFVLTKVTEMKAILPDSLLIVFLIMLLALTLFREPLANLIQGIKPLYSESKADYYIDNGFGVVETLLSLFSNTLSFIRVGAFAINHVGLFMAFETLSEMVSSGMASALIIVIGNIVIIGLEGLIVFIQGLRLEYYELFSKYYDGSGYEFNPYTIRASKGRPQ